MSARTYDSSGALREYWDDDTRTYTAWDEAGTQTLQRPYTPEENAQTDSAVVAATEASNKSTVETNLEEDLEAMQAIIDQDNAALRDDPAQELKDTARAVRRLIRMALDDFTGTE